MWMYHSHTDETRDVNTGLLGVMLVTARGMARPDGSPNRHAVHDLGQALAQLAIQATAQGLGVHLMGGFDPDLARAALRVPAGIEPYTAAAIGWHGGPGVELSPRTRLLLDEVAPRGGWSS